MQALCEQCGSVLPELAPGFVIATCRQCGATSAVRSEGQTRRAEGSANLMAAPPGFLLEKEKDRLRIGWRVFALEPLMGAVGIPLGLWIFYLLHPGLIDQTGPIGKGLGGAVLLVLFYLAAASVVNMYWIEVRGDSLVLGSGPLPLPRSRPMDVRTLRSISVKAIVIRRHRGWVTGTRYVVNARDDGGTSLRLGGEFESESEARFIAESLRTHLGLEETGDPISTETLKI